MIRGMTGRILVAFSCAVAALCTTTSASARTFDGASARAEYSVGYTTASALHAAVGHAVAARIPALRIARVSLSAADAERVSRRPGIRFVQRVRERVSQTEPGLQAVLGKSSAWEWQFAAAHEDTVPESVFRAASGVTIAVIDTGADVAAPDIAAKSPVVFGQRSQSSDVRDSVGHGTFVAALAAGSVTNGEGIAGFGGDAKLMIVKAGAGDGSLTDADEAAAIAYAVDHGARIINLSFGGATSTAAEKNAIDYAAAHGVLVVAAAGNEHLGGNPVFYPAALLQPVGSGASAGSVSRLRRRRTPASTHPSPTPARTSLSRRRATASSRPCRPPRLDPCTRAFRCPARRTDCTATGAARRSPHRRSRAPRRS